MAVGQAEGRTPSLAAAVVRDGARRGSGRGPGRGASRDGDTQYRIGSMTKTFVAVLVMRLRDEGRLDLADPLDKHLTGPGGRASARSPSCCRTRRPAAETPGWWERTPATCAPAR